MNTLQTSLLLPADFSTIDVEEMLYLDGGAINLSPVLNVISNMLHSSVSGLVNGLFPNSPELVQKAFQMAATQAATAVYQFIMGFAPQSPATLPQAVDSIATSLV